MARTSATISVGADTRQLEKDIQRALGRDFKFKGLNEKAFTQPLGRITGAANEFQKSLDASNARVIAFGASAGLIYTVEKAFSALVKSTIDVQKSLTDINVILNVSNKTLQNFGGQLFNIAKNTAQSFDTVAQAATEFSRQGLGVEETLKRTRDALILTRLSGLDTISAVEALTATINSFSNAALDSTTIINKLANVDAAFAVSSADLAEAIKRVGSSAQDVGVDFDQLLAIVTSVQQTTARGGSVIGNSLKTIFTRIQRTDTLDQLERLGISVRTLEGNTLPAITVLSNLASTFNTLSDSQRAQVAETVGGVFQINILKAALGDLQKEYSVYNNALRTASGATDEAIQRNEALNQTLSALINRTFVNLTKVGADIGRISFQPTFENLLNTLNKGLEGLDVEAQTTGGKIARGILEGIGTFISGPGVILATAVIGKLVINLAKFASQSLQTLLNLNTQAEQRAQIQTRINQVLAQEPALVAAVYNKQISVLDIENKILNIIRQQTLERERAAAISTTIAGGLLGKGVTTKGGTLKAKSSGFIPNFAISEIFGALAGGYTPGNIRRMNIPGEGPITYNTAEKVKKFPGLNQPAIMPPSRSMAGKNYKDAFNSMYGFNPYAFDGFIPNFAPLTAQRITSITNEILKGNKPNLKNYTKAQRDQIAAALKQKRQSQLLGGTVEYNASKLGVVGVTGGRGPFNPSTTFAQLGYPNDPRSVRFTGIQGRTIDDLRNNALSQKGEFSRSINSLFANPLTQLASTIFGKVNPDKKFLNLLQSSSRGNINLFPPGTEGSIFEAAVNLATKKGTGALEKAFNQDLAQKPFDFEEYGSPSQQFNRTFGFFPFVTKADAKRTVDTNSAREIIQKAYQIGSGVSGLPKPITKKLASQGFIPNFSALSESIDRELAAGISPSRVRIGRDKRLTSAYNPLGLGIYNTQDEPLGLSQGISRYGGSKAKSAGASKGFIPNFVAPLAVGGIASFLGSTIVRNVLAFAAYSLVEKLGQRLIETIEDQRLKTAVGAGTSALSYAALTGVGGGGKKATLASAGIGLIQGLISNLDSLTSTQKEVIAESESSKDSLSQFSAAMSTYQTSIDKLNNSTLTDIEKTRVLAEKEEALIDIFKETPAKFQEGLKSAIESGDLPRITEELAKVQAVLQSNATNTENLSKIIELTKGGLNTSEMENMAKTLASFKNVSGVSLGMQVRQNPQMLETFRKEIEKAYVGADILNNTKIFNEALKAAVEERFTRRDTKTGQIGYFVPPEERNAEEVAKITREETAKLLAGKQARIETGTRQNIINSLSNFLQKANIPKEVIDKTAADLQSVPFDQLGSSIETLIKLLETLGFKTKEVTDAKEEEKRITKDYILRLAKQAGDLSASSASLEKFQKALSPENLQEYGKQVLNANEQLNANRISAEKVLTLQEGLRTQILNETEQRSAEAKYIQRVNELLVKTGGDLDKFSKALEGSEQEIILESQRRRGLIFAEDYRSGRQAARESRILGGDTQLGDFGAAFFDEFDYRTEDSFREAQLGAKETARTIKSEFNNAFLSFANGSQTASEAFTAFANNIANKIQQLALEFSTNLIFGKLFGSTSNIFGGGGGGLFGNLFGKSQGGLIRGYSTGGHVLGGSGTKDDVPAMLSQGEYVVRKNAVNKYGLEYLQMLNEGKVKKSFLGGPSQVGFNITSISPNFVQPKQQSSYSIAPFISKSNKEDNKYGKRVQKFASGGGLFGQSIVLGSQALLNTISPLASQAQPSNAGFFTSIQNSNTMPNMYKSFIMSMGATNSLPQNLLSTTSPTITRRKDIEENFFKYGGRVQKFASGGELQFLGENVYRYNDPLYPTAGENVIDPRLSLKAILDPNNPQNQIRQEREQALFSYINYVQGVNEANQQALEENIKLNKEIQDQYKRKKNQASQGAWFSYLLGLGGAGLTLFNQGGRVKKFAQGGSSQDNIPALLMGGEFVMRKEAVNLYGKKFFDDLNSGRVKKFAEGGSVGRVSPSEGSNYSPTNNVSVVVNLNQEKIVSDTTQQRTTTQNQDRQDENIRTRELAARVKDQVIRVITEQQRPGGLLSSAIYRKR